MGVKERILTIRLMEKMDRYPAYAKKLGIDASGRSLSSSPPAGPEPKRQVP